MTAECAGRERELTLLSQLLLDQTTVVAIHGISGVGKSTLLEAFAARARASGAVVVTLDGREIEPSERGFLHSLQTSIGGELTTPLQAAERLASLAQRTILMVDSFELLRLLDTWLRLQFVAALPPNVGLLLAGRDPPVAAWFTSLGYDGHFHALTLGPLEEPVALDLLIRAGINRESAKRLHRFTRGHPLALRLAASVVAAWHDDSVERERLASEHVMEELTRVYLADIHDPLTRMAVEASSVTRRTTMSLLRAMLPDHAPQDAYARLHALPFVRLAPDGLYMHDLVRETIAAALRARDPIAHRAFKRAAWQQLRSEIGSADLASLWRYTADLLYLIENPLTREAFFPSNEQRFSMEPARPDDADAISNIAERHEGPQGRAICRAWWEHAARSFIVARGLDGNIHAFYCMVEASTIDSLLQSSDPALEAWRRHLTQSPVGSGEQVLFLRRWLSRDEGEMPCAAQAACWLDIKRTYVEMRPRLRRVYLTLRELESYAPVAQRLFFQPLPDFSISIDGVEHHTALLDFGSRSVDGWLARLASAELGVEDRGRLDLDSHELILQNGRLPLTRLEFAAFRYLYERPERAVSRDELLESVWGYNYQGESNLVDVVIRSLRRKLGDQAPALQTVRGVGYRYRDM